MLNIFTCNDYDYMRSTCNLGDTENMPSPLEFVAYAGKVAAEVSPKISREWVESFLPLISKMF